MISGDSSANRREDKLAAMPSSLPCHPKAVESQRDLERRLRASVLIAVASDQADQRSAARTETPLFQRLLRPRLIDGEPAPTCDRTLL